MWGGEERGGRGEGKGGSGEEGGVHSLGQDNMATPLEQEEVEWH